MKSIKEVLEKMKAIHRNILKFIEDEDNIEENFENLIKCLNDCQITNNLREFKQTLSLISKIANNHYRNRDFFDKIERILTHFQTDLQKNFTNDEIFNFFKNNKRILLFLIESKIIVINDSIEATMTSAKYQKFLYDKYFFPELKPFQSNVLKGIEITENQDEFEKKRKIGENDNELCQMIRNDSIHEFITYVNRNNLQLTELIKESPFETNSFLLKKQPTLIEYAAFFGSIQIFKYLYLNDAEFNRLIWLYVIHSQNPELIHFLNDNKNETFKGSYFNCFKESIKCHHNEIAYFIQDNLFNSFDLLLNNEDNYNENMVAYGFHFLNYEFIPNDLSHKFTIFYLVYYGYLDLLNVLLKTENCDLNNRMI